MRDPKQNRQLGELLLAHLTRRERLTSAEERRLDLDGDGRITARDLYLARSEERLEKLGEIKTAESSVPAGRVMKCKLYGKCPSGLRAQLRDGGKPRELEMETREENGRQLLFIHMPDDVAGGKRVRASLWFTAPQHIPRCLKLVIFGQLPDRDGEEKPATETAE
jgi:hypothetical protein